MGIQLIPVLLLLGTGLAGESCRNLSGASDDAAGGEDTCQDRAARAQQDVEAARLANLECSEPRDCVLVDLSTQCRGDCPRPVAATGRQAVEDAVTRVNETVCRDYVADGCAVATPGCAPVEATCQAGACVSAPLN